MITSRLPSDAAVYRIASIRQIESTAMANLPSGSLMRAAGKAAADFAKKLIIKPGKKVLALAGPGNNGGDALEAAHLLAAAGFDVMVMLCADINGYSSDALQSLQRAQAGNVIFIDAGQPQVLHGKRWALVIDGLFGIGLARAITGPMAALIQQVNQLSNTRHFPVLALDVPSGLNADTGQIIGDPGVALRATHTITFIGNKPGLHTAAGRDFCGQVEVADLGIFPELYPSPCAYLSHPGLFYGSLQARCHDSHKGSYGDVLIIGGATGMIGAPLLAARAAIHCGAGRVYVGFVGGAPLFDSQYPELMCRPVNDCNLSQSVIVIGPGLGDSGEAEQLLSRALREATAMVIDADALNLLANNPSLQMLLAARHERNARTILTPHPLEAARLLKLSAREIQSDRLENARELANKFKACVILKGAGTIIACIDETSCINTTGNPALATAGTGDVLAGVCGALLAQHVVHDSAAKLAVWLHGLAADQLVQQGIGPVGMTAGELIPAIRLCLNEFIATSSKQNQAHAGG